MVAFLPILYYAAAGLAALTLGGCAGSHPLPPPKTPTPKKPEPPKAPELPKGPDFPKNALLFGSEGFEQNGYEILRENIGEYFNLTRGAPISLKDYAIFTSRDEASRLLANSFLENPNRAAVAKKFLDRVGASDGKPDDLSLYDYLFSSFYLYSTQWGEEWQQNFLADDKIFPFSIAEHVKILGGPLLDPATAETLSTQSRTMLQSLSEYLKGQEDQDIDASLSPLVDFFLKGEEPQVFFQYFNVPYKEFLNSTDEKKSEIFQQALEKQSPSPEMIEELSPYLQVNDMFLLTKECFKKDTKSAFALFEKITLGEYFSQGQEGSSHEAKIFPNLAQDTPFPDRQKAIDDFLGEPILVREKRNPMTGIKTTVKKYQWPKETEVFSIESGKPGPTTLVFSPHFHEQNPRKYFHWLKDIPLQTGRVIFIPEANRGMWKAGRNTNPMNGLFNEALLSQRIDYIIVRRVEYLIGLADGVIGDHDASDGPYYISDILADKHGKGQAALGPQPSPWIPREVKDVKTINFDKDKPKTEAPKKTGPVLGINLPSVRDIPPRIYEDNQIQWQIADYSRKKLRKLTGMDFHFVPELIQNENSGSADSTTGYAQFHLGKPAMTFEGSKAKEHGQLHAMAIYTLLLGFGHKISPQFEKKLKDPLPKVEPDLYRGNFVTLTNEPVEKSPDAR